MCLFCGKSGKLEASLEIGDCLLGEREFASAKRGPLGTRLNEMLNMALSS